MMALVSAGFALGLAGAAHIATSRELGVVARPLASRVPPLTTYLLRLDGDPSDELTRRAEESRVGKECVSKGGSRREADQSKKKRRGHKEVRTTGDTRCGEKEQKKHE